MAWNRPDPQVHHGFIPRKVLQCGIALTPIGVCQPFAIFFMQHWGNVYIFRMLCWENRMQMLPIVCPPDARSAFGQAELGILTVYFQVSPDLLAQWI
jgi:hypothetical protein